MKKIPTLFQRDPQDMKHVLPEVHPDCQWVLDGEGIATRKYDGTCVLLRRDGVNVKAFARREVKRGKGEPDHFMLIERDETTGKRVGWEPAEQSGSWKFIDEAIQDAYDSGYVPLPGTYELCGPKINGNPEGFTGHILIEHANADRLDFRLESGVPQAAFVACRAFLLDPKFTHEGIVWHHPDGRMAKLKVRDFA